MEIWSCDSGSDMRRKDPTSMCTVEFQADGGVSALRKQACATMAGGGLDHAQGMSRYGEVGNSG